MKLFFLIVACFSVLTAFTQSIAINDNGAIANSHSILDIDVAANDKGVLIPRVTSAQRISIAGLALIDEGLCVYDVTTKSFWYWDGTTWVQIQPGSAGWLTTGNTGTTAGTHFLGTTDNQSLEIRTNNVIKTRITTKGQIEILNTGNSIFIGEAAGANDDLTTNRNNFIGYQSGNLTTIGFNNNAVGYQSLFNNTNGQENAAFGFRSLYSNTNGYNNSGFGDQTLWQNTTGIFNSAVGGQTLYANTTGNNNTAMGTGSLFSNITGSRNSGFGVQTLGQNISSEDNAAFGYQALYVNSTSSRNVAIGAYALTSQSFNNGGIVWNSENTAVGYQALFSNQPTSNTNGVYNVAVGSSSLYTNTAGACNTAVGKDALHNNTTGSINTACGYEAGYSNTFGFHNTSFGALSLRSTTSGSMNTAIGYSSLYANSTGYFNMAGGTYALYDNTTGYQCTAIGMMSLENNVTGFNNTAVGFGTDVNAGAYSNSTCLGYAALITASNQVRIGNAMVTSIGGQVGWTTLSDKRIKTNVREDVPGLSFIKKLQPVTYEYDQAMMNTIIRTNGKPDVVEKTNHIRYTGFFAQDVEKSANELGFEFSGVDAPKNENDLYGLRYGDFTVPLVKAVQEQQAIIEELKNQILILQEEIKAMKKTN